MRNLFENNGISMNFINKLKVGDSLILVPTNNGLIDSPFEFIIDEINMVEDHNPSDHFEMYPAKQFVSIEKISIIIDDSLGIPHIDNYDMFKNYKDYFEKYNTIINDKIKKVKREVDMIKAYQTFKKQFISENPEKLI